MELLKDLELVDVKYDNKKAILIFLDEMREEVREVNFNLQVYDPTTKAFIDSDEKEEKVKEWCEKYFNTTFEGLIDCVGIRKDVYVYDNFCSLWETENVEKFKEEDLGLIDIAIISDVVCDNVGIKIKIKYEDKIYESKMSYSVYLESRKVFMTDPHKKEKQFKAFEEKFGVNPENKDKLIGKEVMFEVKKAMGKFVYIDIKADKKTKKKK